MSIPYYLPGTIFLGFIIFCIVCLVLIYWKANAFLQNHDGGRDGTAEDPLDGLSCKEEEEADGKTVTYIKMKSFASIEEKDTTFVEESEELEIIENTTLDIAMKYIDHSNYLTIRIDSMDGLKDIAVRAKESHFRFHATLLPSKKQKFKSGYRSLKELKVNILSGLDGVTIDDLKCGTLRLRLYSRRFQFGVPVFKERCIGEIYIQLAKYLEKLEKGEEARTKQAILPKAEQFPVLQDNF